MEMGDSYVSPDSERQILHVFIHMKNLDFFFFKHEVEGRLLGKKKVTSGQGRDGKRGNMGCDQRTLDVYTRWHNKAWYFT